MKKTDSVETIKIKNKAIKPAATKVPKAKGMMKKTYKPMAFDKKLLKKTAKPADRVFLSSCFEERDGLMSLKAGLEPAALKRLNKLGKTIKSNRGWFKPASIVFVALVAGGGTAFGLAVMNPLLEGAFVSTLELLFEGRSDVEGFRFRPLAMEVEFSSLTIADRDEPMKNLFETGPVRIALNPDAVLRGRIHIRDLQLEGLVFGTERTVSGALPDRVKKEKEPKKSNKGRAQALPPLIDFANFDPMAILEREKEGLKTTQAWRETEKTIIEREIFWRNRVESTREQLSDFFASSERLRRIEVKNLKTLDELRSSVQDAERVIASGRGLVNEATRIRSELEADIERIKALEREARSAIDRDYQYLVSFVDFRSGRAMAVFEPLVRDLLTDTGEEYFAVGERVVEVLERLINEYGPMVNQVAAAMPAKNENGATKKGKEPRLKGQTVNFTQSQYPAFRLDRLSTSFTLDGLSWNLGLENISSAPDDSTAATLIRLGLSEGVRSAALSLSLDLAPSRDFSYSLEATLAGFEADLKDVFAPAGIGAFAGRIGGALYIKGSASGAFEMSVPLIMDEPRLDHVEGTIAEIVADTIRSAGKMELDISYASTQSGEDSFALETNIDRLVSEAVSKLLAKYIDQAKRDLERALRNYIATEFDGKITSEDLDLMLGVVRQDEASLARAQAMLDAKKREFEAEIRAKAADAVKDAIDQNISPELRDKLDSDRLRDIKIPGIR